MDGRFAVHRRQVVERALQLLEIERTALQQQVRRGANCRKALWACSSSVLSMPWCFCRSWRTCWVHSPCSVTRRPPAIMLRLRPVDSGSRCAARPHTAAADPTRRPAEPRCRCRCCCSVPQAAAGLGHRRVHRPLGKRVCASAAPSQPDVHFSRLMAEFSPAANTRLALGYGKSGRGLFLTGARPWARFMQMQLR